ncbi:hypothetical protein MPOR_19650 [Mycolicibacterium poriferae]|uniref:Uncharacterized protein n=1 Tax=Mycolicibacterium poriferae TaxID=39694 RepID=A0A6N4V959_9MYCO|nr:hypothetical protein MPOR_19650 [Mycolicibacterium poriferae]
MTFNQSATNAGHPHQVRLVHQLVEFERDAPPAAMLPVVVIGLARRTPVALGLTPRVACRPIATNSAEWLKRGLFDPKWLFVNEGALIAADIRARVDRVGELRRGLGG